jgi:hypothetical protein
LKTNVAPKFVLNLLVFRQLFKVSNRPIGENSPIPVTLMSGRVLDLGGALISSVLPLRTWWTFSTPTSVSGVSEGGA